MFKQTPAFYHAKSLLVLRVVLAVVLVLHGYPKLFGGIENFAGMLDMLKFPLPTFMAYVVSLLEFVGGLALLAGLFTRYVAALVSLQFLVILIFVKHFVFPDVDVDFLILGIALALTMLGGGTWSLDAQWVEKKK